MRARTRIKICGITTVEEAALAVDAGADAIGMIFTESPRRISVAAARTIVGSLPALVTPVAVVVDPTPMEVEELVRIGCVPQFCGDEPPEFCRDFAPHAFLKVLHVGVGETEQEVERRAERYAHAVLLFDTRVAGARGGTGRAFDWNIVRGIASRRRVIMSGGLTPDNVGDCVRGVRPYAVDVRSGVETQAKKDPERIAAFVGAVREADA